MPATSLIFRFIGIDDGAGAQFKAMATEADATRASFAKFAAGSAIAFGIVAVESLKSAAKFQSSMELIHTQAGVGQAQVNAWSKSILGLSGQVAESPEALSEALFHIASTGQRGTAALNELRIAAEGAKVGGADLTDVTNALNATIVSGIHGANNFSSAMGALNAIVGAGDMHMQDLADALGSGVLIQMRTFGVNLNQTGAALAVFGDNNIRGAQAATYLRQAVQSISDPAATASGALSKIHVTVTQLQDSLAKGGLTGALELLHSHFESSGIAANKWGDVLEQAFTKKAGTGISILVEEFGRYQVKQAEVAEGAKSFGDDWTATTKTLSFQTQRFQADIEALAAKFGTDLIPAALGAERGIEDVGDAVAATVGFFAKHEAVTLALAGALTGALLPALARTGVEMSTLVGKTILANLLAMKVAIFGIAGAEDDAAASSEAWVASMGPIGLLLAGAGALAGVMWAKNREANEKAKQAVDDYVQSLHTETDSLASLQSSITQLTAHYQPLLDAHHEAEITGNHLIAGAIAGSGAYKGLTSALGTYRTQQKAVAGNETLMAREYGMTKAQVERLAQTNNIDLTGSLTSVDHGFQQVVAAANLSKSPIKEANSNFAQMAQSSTDAATELQNLGTSFNDLVGNFVGMKQAQIDFKNDLEGTIKALAKSHGAIGLNSQASRDAGTAYHSLVTEISSVTGATYTSSKSMGAAQKAASLMLKQLEQLPVKGPQVRNVIQGLEHAIDGMAVAAAATGANFDAALAGSIRDHADQILRAGAYAAGLADVGARGKDGIDARSPSRKGVETGKNYTHAIKVGIDKGGHEVYLSGQHVAQLLTDGMLHGWTGDADSIKNALSTSVQNALEHLETLTKNYLSKEQQLVKAARQKLASDLSSKRSDVSSLAGTISGGADLSNLFGTSSTGAPTMQNVNGFLGAQVGPLARFAQDLKWARGHGLNKVLLSDIANLGPVQGEQVLKQFTSGAASISQADASESLIQRYSTAGAKTTENALYKATLAKDRAKVEDEVRTLHRIERHLALIEKHAASDIAQHVTIQTDGKGLKLTEEDARVIVAALRKLDKRTKISVVKKK